MDEQRLTARVLAGDAAAERQLYDTHVDRVYRLAYRLSRDDELAREFVQDTFVRVFQRLDGFRHEAALSTWIHAVAMSVILTGLRRVRRMQAREVELDDIVVADIDPRCDDPELGARVHAAIDGLPDIYRAIFVMHELEGYTHEEIGAALGLAPGTSKARLSRARHRLRTVLASYAEEFR
jgi:RNA polymerase sigma-70 factor (ECF subfamily)